MRNPDVLVQIQRVDALLESSGVRAHCLECINGPEGGCCQGCDLLGPEGCTNKPLACALWVCHRVKINYPEVASQLHAVKMQWPWQVSLRYRQQSLEAEAEMLEVCA